MLEAGTVTVADDGVATATPGSLAEMYYATEKEADDEWAALNDAPPPSIPTTDAGYVTKLRYFAHVANKRAAKFHAYWLANVTVKINPGDQIQKLPATIATGEYCDGPTDVIGGIALASPWT